VVPLPRSAFPPELQTFVLRRRPTARLRVPLVVLRLRGTRRSAARDDAAGTPRRKMHPGPGAAFVQPSGLHAPTCYGRFTSTTLALESVAPAFAPIGRLRFAR